MKIFAYTFSLVLMLVGATQANAAIIYSGPDRNIIYSDSYIPDVISLFDAPGTWDNMVLTLSISSYDPDDQRYEFHNLGVAHGHYVEFALSEENDMDIKNFAEGDLIDASSTFVVDDIKYFSTYRVENWDPDHSRIEDHGEFRDTLGFVGIRFKDGADIYYGWMRVSISNYNNSDFMAVIIDWAYENTPGVGIRAGATPIPEPTTTAMLLAGAAAGLAVLRRRRRA
jgi:hypothetical protein